MEIKIIEQTHNARKVVIENPSEKLLRFVASLEERKRKQKEEIAKKEYKIYQKI